MTIRRTRSPWPQQAPREPIAVVGAQTGRPRPMVGARVVQPAGRPMAGIQGRRVGIAVVPNLRGGAIPVGTAPFTVRGR